MCSRHHGPQALLSWICMWHRKVGLLCLKPNIFSVESEQQIDHCNLLSYERATCCTVCDALFSHYILVLSG